MTNVTLKLVSTDFLDTILYLNDLVLRHLAETFLYIQVWVVVTQTSITEGIPITLT